MQHSRKTTRKSPRVAVAAALAAGTVTLFGALGGVGVAQSAISAVQYQYGAKVTICHKGKTLSVSKNAVKAHVHKHADTLGPCPNAAAKAKANKVKAEKAKAEKAKAEKVETEKAKTETIEAEKAETEKVKAEKDKAEKQRPEKGEQPGKGKGKGK